MQLGDRFALQLQELRKEGWLDEEQPLVRIDYRREAADAPYQFDMANAKLHCTGCEAIGQDAQSALYAVWEVRPADIEYACEECQPVPTERKVTEENQTLDLIFGFLSVLDQFGSVLNERGKEYRDSERGRQIEATMRRAVSDLDRTQQQALDAMLSSLDQFVKAVNSYSQNLQDQTSHNGRKGGPRVAGDDGH